MCAGRCAAPPSPWRSCSATWLPSCAALLQAQCSAGQPAVARGSARVGAAAAHQLSLPRRSCAAVAHGLAAAGRHVRSCHLQCSFGNNAECAWEMAACLGALAAARSLQQLNLYFGCMGAALCVTSWCEALRQLSELELLSGVSELCICSSLEGLSAVTQLSLSGTALILDGTAQLPPNVERLSLGCGRAALPLQVSPAWSLWQAGGRSHSKHAKKISILSIGTIACVANPVHPAAAVGPHPPQHAGKQGSEALRAAIRPSCCAAGPCYSCQLH